MLQVGRGLFSTRRKLLAAFGNFSGGMLEANGTAANRLQRIVNALNKGVKLLGEVTNFIAATTLDTCG